MLVSNIRKDGQLIGGLPDGEMYFHSDQCYVERPIKATTRPGMAMRAPTIMPPPRVEAEKPVAARAETCAAANAPAKPAAMLPPNEKRATGSPIKVDAT